MKVHTSDRTLYALYCLSRETLPIDAGALGRLTGVSATQTAVALVQLERRGYVNASRIRLTMLGLARAVRLGMQAGGGASGRGLARTRRPPGSLQRARRERSIKPPVAARAHAASRRTPGPARGLQLA